MADTNGLCIEVRPSGSKLWRYRYRHAGKASMAALGEYPLMTLAEVRVDGCDCRIRAPSPESRTLIDCFLDVVVMIYTCSEDRFAGPHSSASSRRSAATWARPTGSSAPPARTSQ